MFKYITTPFISLFAIGTIALLAYLQGFTTFTFAWALNFMLMMGVSTLMQTFKPGLTANYFDAKAWETDGKLYRWFGVNGYRKLLVWVGWEKLQRAGSPVKKDLQALRLLEYNTRQSELGHLLIFYIVLGFTVFVVYQHGLKQSLWLISLNLILNIYPIFVQRFNRPRLQRAIEVYERFQTVPSTPIS